MPRALPSQLDKYLTSVLPIKDEYVVAEIEQKIGAIAGFLELYDHVPHELLALPPADYADLVSAIGAIRFSTDQRRLGSNYDCLKPICTALPTAWKLIKVLPDSIPATTHDLSFITDADIRDMVNLDISAIATDLHAGEWKSATILFGSCCEALLLYQGPHLAEEGSQSRRPSRPVLGSLLLYAGSASSPLDQRQHRKRAEARPRLPESHSSRESHPAKGIVRQGHRIRRRRRVKENIATTSLGLDTLLQLPVHDFDFMQHDTMSTS